MIKLEDAHEIIMVARGDNCTDETMAELLRKKFVADRIIITREIVGDTDRPCYVARMPGTAPVLCELGYTIKMNIPKWLSLLPHL